MNRKTDLARPRQLELALDAPVLRGLEQEDRKQAVELLAQLLLEASGLIDEEDGDEDV
jgi:hypothetical protein